MTRKRPDMIGNKWAAGNTHNIGRVSPIKGKLRTSVWKTCACGTKFIAKRCNLKRGLDKNCGAICASKMRKESCKKNSGPRHYKWIIDRTKLKKGDEYRNSPAHREWSRSVKLRDGWKCKISNSDCAGHVVAHHILPWRDYIELRYEVNNGITLCHVHHPRKRNDEVRLSPYFKELVNTY